MPIKPHQEAFMVFFAIFWGLVANVQPRWKAFQWPLVFKCDRRLNVVRNRVLLALVVLDVLPVVYFWLTFCWIADRNPTTWAAVTLYGVVPAFGIFGLYRFWLALVEWKPMWFYQNDVKQVPEAYRHVEPTYRRRYDEEKKDEQDMDVRKEYNTPIVDLGEGVWWGNLLAGLVYLAVATLLPLAWPLFA